MFVGSLFIANNAELQDVSALHDMAADEVDVSGPALSKQAIQDLYDAIEANSTP